jgi:hypothetical protein
MAERPQSRGECAYCGAVIARGGASRHLDACARRREAIAQADSGGGARELLLHLRVTAEGSSEFWLDLEMRGSASLKTLDTYLRAIWLECCGHLSRFSAGASWGSDISMRRKAADVFRPGLTLVHEYDFGTSSYTQIRVAGERTGVPTTRHPIALMMRNVMPEAQCGRCDQPATHLCPPCHDEMEPVYLFCAEHAKKHRHRDYEGTIALVNSPRMGMCGYEGPADPPY